MISRDDVVCAPSQAWVWLEHTPAGLKRDSRAALALARAAGRCAVGLTAVEHAEDTRLVGLARDVAACGGQWLMVLLVPKGMSGQPEALAAALVEAERMSAGRGEAPVDILASANALGRDLLARVAARLAAPLLQDCVAVDLAAGQGEKYLLSGRTAGAYRLPGPLNCWTLRPNVFAEPPHAGAVEAVPVIPVSYVRVSGSRPCVRVVDEEREEAGAGGNSRAQDELAGLWARQPDIVEAPIIIAGGRVVGSAENFRLLHRVAGKVGAAVGASRSAVDLGYAPASVQVGQTGVVVSPDLYIACGISGSVYHLAGINMARRVVVINTDPAAPIFAKADYGLQGDLFAVLPLLGSLIGGDGQV